MGPFELTLTALHVYPIKSAGGLAPHEWEVDARGFRYDRRWMVVDGAGTMLSQRTHPRLALVRPSIGDGTLRVETDGLPPLELPLDPADAVSVAVTVWDDACGASWAGERAADWFADLLETDCMLVHMPDSSVRLANPRYAPGEHPVSFADAFPFLLLSDASLAALNQRLATPLPMNRFRPNLVLGGGEPHVEDHLEDFRAGGIGMRAVKPCDRCMVTTTDQATAERGVEPLRTLAGYRKVGAKVMFGQNVVHFGAGRLRVGDRVQGRLSERARVEL